MKKNVLALAAFIGTMAISAHAGTPLFETGFETSADPSGASYTLGALAGQGAVGSFAGWQVTGTANVVDTPLTAHSGANYVNQQAGSEITASLADSSPRMIVRAYHNGNGATVPTNPTPGVDAAAVLAFEAVDANNYRIQAFNGDAMPPAFEAPAGDPTFSTADWHEVLLGVNYGDQVYHIMVDGDPYLNTLGFFSDTVTQFNGFRASTTVGSNIDTVGFFPSNGDYDGDGFSDDIEFTTDGGDPLNAALFPLFGDVNGDLDINLLDALLHFRAVSMIISSAGLDISQDFNSDGMTMTIADSATFYAFLVGDPAVPIIPTL
jgi:hypothetical protein